MPSRPILILGGTRDARDLATDLVARGLSPVTSLAGVTGEPVLPPGRVRIGGFGGTEGLAAYLVSETIAVVIDATHPFAARMSQQAAEACSRLGLPLLRLERPAWAPREGDRWSVVPSAVAAAAALPSGARVLLTIGRKEALPFFSRHDLSGIARMIETPDADVPLNWRLLRERPPFTLARETSLMTENGITHLVSKNAGGTLTEAKITAARACGTPVVMIARPPKPHTPVFTSTQDAAEAVERVLSP